MLSSMLLSSHDEVEQSMSSVNGSWGGRKGRSHNGAVKKSTGTHATPKQIPYVNSHLPGHRRRRRHGGHALLDAAATDDAVQADAARPVGLQVCCASDGGEDDGDYEGDEDDGADSVYDHDAGDALTDDSDCACAGAAEKSAVGKLVRFIGEKVWGPWA